MKYGRYVIQKELGKGAMGVVYQAHDPNIGRMVALKVLRPERVTNDAFVKRFLREARAIGRLSHPNIVIVHDVDEDHQTVFISMEFLEGKPLNDLIQEKSFKLEEVVDIGVQMAEALDYAHQKGIVHRDIKPANIIIQPNGQVKITDFGIAHVEDPELTQHTQAGEILGTPAYMSPEQVLGQPADGRSDLFSLGVILYEMTTGKRPFAGQNLATIFQRITNERPEEPTTANPSASPELSKVIMKCLEKSPEKRFATGSELSGALKSCLSEIQTIPIPHIPPQPKSPARGLRKLITISVALAALAILVVVVGGRIGPQKNLTPNRQSDTTEQKPPKDITETGPPADISKTDSGTHQSPGLPDSTPTKTPSFGTTKPDMPPIDTSLPKGTLKLESTPRGAQVSIDGEARGLTPLDLELGTGMHEIKVSLAEHGDWEAQVKIVEDKVTHIPVELLPMPDKNR